MAKSKFVLFIAASTLSLSASAAFVQYNFVDTTFSDGGTLNGYFVQNTDDKAIAYFSLNVAGGAQHGAQFFPSGTTSNIASADTYFAGAGPTNFSVFNNQDVVYYFLDVEFGSTGTAGTYRVFGNNDQVALTPDAESGSRSIAGGFAVQGAVDADLLAYLEGGPIQEINYIVPQYAPEPARVPEPGSLALLMLGVAGLAGVRRKVGAAA
jgi:hypothetical protein